MRVNGWTDVCVYMYVYVCLEARKEMNSSIHKAQDMEFGSKLISARS